MVALSHRFSIHAFLFYGIFEFSLQSTYSGIDLVLNFSLKHTLILKLTSRVENSMDPAHLASQRPDDLHLHFFFQNSIHGV